MSRVLIGYRDYVQYGTLDTASTGTEGGFDDTIFAAGSPFSNAQTRQLAVKAVLDISPHYSFFFVVDFGEDREIGLVAMLATNFNRTNGTAQYRASIGSAPFTGTLVDHNPGWLPADDSALPRNIFWVFDPMVTGRYLTIAIDIGVAGPLPFIPQFGRLWAGPVWTPEEVEGVSRDEFDPRIADDNSTLNKSRGGQNYADVAARFRVHTMRLPYLTEADAIGTEDGTTQNLQDIAFEVGKTQPVIVIPSLASNHIVHKFGLYGCFEEPPSPRLIPESSERHYDSTFTVIEEL